MLSEGYNKERELIIPSWQGFEVAEMQGCKPGGSLEVSSPPFCLLLLLFCTVWQTIKVYDECIV